MKTMSSKSSQSSELNEVENNIDLIGSSTVCLVNLDDVSVSENTDCSSLSGEKTQQPIADKTQQQETTSINGVLKSSKLRNAECENEKDNKMGSSSSTPTFHTARSDTSGRRSGANLTVTFDFDYEDRSLGSDISDTPRNRILKEVPKFLQTKILGPVKDLVTNKRLASSTPPKVSDKGETDKPPMSSNLSSSNNLRTRVDVVRKKSMAPQPPSRAASTNPRV